LTLRAEATMGHSWSCTVASLHTVRLEKAEVGSNARSPNRSHFFGTA
jgi:hypothetical protein